MKSTRADVADGFVNLTCLALGLTTLAFGGWAFFAPESFFEVVARFEPYNRHLLHDAGALQIGIGVALLLAAIGRPSTVVGLGGFVAFEALHVVAHVMDRELGGQPVRDIAFLVALTVVGAAALFVRRRRHHTGGEG